MKSLPSIRGRLSRALFGWSAVWGVAVAAAIVLSVPHEVNELLDDTLEASAEVLAALLSPTAGHLSESSLSRAGVTDDRFAWQVVGPASELLLRSPRAPSAPLQATPTSGFTDTPDWRVFGVALGSEGRMLYVAQTRAEREEAQFELALSPALAALAIGLLGHLWLRARVRHELEPLQTLSRRLAGHDPTAPGSSLGRAEREELQVVHGAIDALGRRLAHRLDSERAFSAHAAHALRTPLAGIDAQLANALRDSPPSLQPRLQRARDAAARLQRVVAALLALFRSSADLQRTRVDLNALLPRLSIDGLMVEVPPGAAIDADADLLAAALLNLLDNARRYGARRVLVSTPHPGVVSVHDDGPGVSAARRMALQQAIDGTAGEAGIGLGLRLADLVARAHGGALVLPDVATGFTVDLVLQPMG
jgi:signal transduction histidine kinase